MISQATPGLDDTGTVANTSEALNNDAGVAYGLRSSLSISRDDCRAPFAATGSAHKKRGEMLAPRSLLRCWPPMPPLVLTRDLSLPNASRPRWGRDAVDRNVRLSYRSSHPVRYLVRRYAGAIMRL